MFAFSMLLCMTLAALVLSTGRAAAVDCISYLFAERVFQEKTGSAPDHPAIERALAAVPAKESRRDGGPWDKYIDAKNELKWASDHQKKLRQIHDRQTILGGSVPNYSIRSKIAFKSVTDALDKSSAASKALNRWLRTHGIDEATAELFKWFATNHIETHSIFASSAPPDLVYRVSVHERRTRCPS